MYSNIPKATPIERGIDEVLLKDGERLTRLSFEKNGTRVEIFEGVDSDFFTISEIPSDVKETGAGNTSKWKVKAVSFC